MANGGWLYLRVDRCTFVLMLKRFLILQLVLIPLLIGCAKMGPPPGGDVDKRPPVVISTIPAHESTRVPLDIAVEILFDETVKRETLLPAFSLSPPPPGRVRSKWKGKSLTLLFDPQLSEDRTYVLTLGTDLSDLRGNKLTDAFYLAFSTGDSLDRGRISGYLKVDGGSQGWNVVGYRLDERRDTTGVVDPNPAVDLPDAATQAGADGSWRLQHLTPGIWRVFAYKDQDRSRLHTPWLEPIAVPAKDVTVSQDTLAEGAYLVLVAAPPRKSPAPMRVSARLRNILEIKFDPAPSVIDGRFMLLPKPDSVEVDTSWNVVSLESEVQVAGAEYKPGDSTVVRLHLTTPPEGDVLFLRVEGKFGGESAVDSVFTVPLLESASEDTFPPTLVRLIPDKGSRIYKGKRNLQLLFSERMSTAGEGAVRLITPDRDTLDQMYTWSRPERLEYTFPDLPEGGQLQLQLFGEQMRDAAGNSLLDSLQTFSFVSLPDDSLGRISGVVRTGGEEGRIHLTFRCVTATNLPVTLTLPREGEFHIRGIPSGGWRAEGWLDRSRTERFESGHPYPFKPSDPYVVSTDTIHVRARWESGGTEIIFR